MLLSLLRLYLNIRGSHEPSCKRSDDNNDGTINQQALNSNCSESPPSCGDFSVCFLPGENWGEICNFCCCGNFCFRSPAKPTKPSTQLTTHLRRQIWVCLRKWKFKFKRKQSNLVLLLFQALLAEPIALLINLHLPKQTCMI